MERSRQLGMSEPDLLRSYPQLRPKHLTNAWWYVAAFREEIKRDIAANEE